MRNIIILILVFLNTTYLFPQDREPSPWGFVWGYSDNHRVFDPDSVKQESIITGFQWAGSLKMNNALKINAYASNNYPEVDSNSRAYPLEMINQPKWWDLKYSPGFWHAPFMQYKPTLELTEANFGDIIRPADPSNPIFGFLHNQGMSLSAFFFSTSI